MGNPVNCIDPDGKFAINIALGIGGAIVGASINAYVSFISGGNTLEILGAAAGGALAGAITGATLGAGSSLSATIMITGGANAAGTIAEKSTTRLLDGEDVIQEDKIVSDVEDIAASACIGGMVGPAVKGLGNLSKEMGKAIGELNKQIDNLSNSIIHRSKSAITKSAATINNLKNQRTTLDLAKGIVDSEKLIIDKAGTTLVNKGYEERKKEQ